MTIEETISSYWNYWCYFERVVKNRYSGKEILVGSGNYVPEIFGMMRIGEKVSRLNSSEDIVERYLSAFKPDISRMCDQDYPTVVELTLRFLSHEINSGETEINVTVKPFANDNGRSWATTSPISYNLIKEHYVPFDITLATYISNLSEYEKTESINQSENRVYFGNLILLMWKFMQKNSIGFTISASGGICNLYGPSYTLYFLRPLLTVRQVVDTRMRSNVILDTQIAAEAKVKGKCKDRDGNVITGRQCRVIAFDPSDYEILGTGLSSSSTGSFLFSINYKVGYPVIVSFIDDVSDITGCEVMTSLSKDTV